MLDRRDSFRDPIELRRRAEAALTESPYASGSARASETDLRRLLHELEVHQVELEIQNAELVAVRDDVEAGLRRYTEVFDFAPIGYFVVTAAGVVRELNLAGARLLGAPRQRLLGRRLSRFLFGHESSAFARFLGRVLTGEEHEVETCELPLAATDGGARDVRITGSRLADRASTATALLAMEDVTERNRAESELREASRRKDEFLAVLSHELRNPMAPIWSSLHILERAEAGGTEAQRAQTVIGRQIVHLGRIVDDLLDVSRMDRGKVRLQRDVVDVVDVVRRTMDDYQRDFETRGVILEAAFAPEALWVDADATRLVQVVGNLLTNAAKFTPAGGKVHVSLRREGRDVVLTVRDTGMGIAADVRRRLFTPFWQAPQSSDRAKGGLGLGLVLVKGFVELHGGTVSVASEGLGRGAEFTVRLPSAPGPAANASPRGGGEHHEGPHRRVLVIDDNEDGANSLRDVLELSGHEVQIAHDGPHGIGVAREFRPEIVICDIGLPGMDGYDVARAMRAEADLKGAFLVALTGYALPEDVRRANEAGFDRHVAKPPSIEKLERVLAEASAAS
jgi:PAS domain S-box-containing protein